MLELLFCIFRGTIEVDSARKSHVQEDFLTYSFEKKRFASMNPDRNDHQGRTGAQRSKVNYIIYGMRSISLATDLRICNTSVLSVLHGAETWPLHRTLARRLDGFDSRALRTILNSQWSQHTSNEELRARTQQPPASCLAAQRRLRWLGHVIRMSPDHPTRALLAFDPATARWTRPRGRPRTRCCNIVWKNHESVGLTRSEADLAALDRVGWRL